MTTESPDPRRRASLEEILAEDVGGLIAQARVEARERARAQLVEVMSEALVARALAELGQAPARSLPRPEPAPEAEAEQSVELGGETALYVYCVVRAEAEIPERLTGIERGHPPTVLRHDGLGAVLSDVPLEDFGEVRLRERLADMHWLEHAARTHENVLEEIAGTATLIPMRLCSVFRSERGVREMLTREARALTEALDHLEGKAEWAVKVFASPPAEAQLEARQDGSGTDYMRRRQSERDRRRNSEQELHEACVAIHERLSEVAAESMTSAPQRPEVSGHPGEMLLNGVYLVEDKEREPFLALVDELQAEYRTAGLDLRPTGPWPAYSFVPGTIGAAW